MNNILRKLKLIDHFTIELNITKNEFVQKLSSITDKDKTGMFNILSSSDKDFRGEVTLNGFKLQKITQHLERNLNWAIAIGKIFEKENFLIVDIAIKGFVRSLILGYLVILISSIFFINITQVKSMTVLPFPFIGISVIIFLFPYLNMKSDVERLKNNLEIKFRNFEKKL